MANETRNTGIGFLELLAIVFIILKLTGHISWSWLWVFSPLWIPIVLVVTFFLAYVIVDAIDESRK